MDGSDLPSTWISSVGAHEDRNSIDAGLIYLADTALCLNSHVVASVTREAGPSKRKWHAVDETLDLENEASLALELGSSRSCVQSKTSYGASGIFSTSNKNVEEQSLLDLCLDFNLNLGRACKVFKNSGTSHVAPTNEKFNVDLELSLSTGAIDSDLTSVTLASSPIGNSVETPALSSIDQLVDEGSTSSKWKGGPLVLLNKLQTSNVLVPSEDNIANNVYSVSIQTDFPSVQPQPPTTDHLSTLEAKSQRRTTVKICQFPGCEKGARGASGYCISHGGGRRCQRPGCQKGAEGKTAFCKAHGGGRRCEYLGCTKSAEGRTNLCIAHGGGRRCTFPGGCTRAARGKSGLCIRHGGGKRCKMENCTRSAEGLSGLCIGHGGGRRCQFPQCNKGAQGSTKFCKAHGGGKRCTFLGCTKGAEGSTLFCKGHGGGKRCSFQGGGICTKSVHGGTLFCVSHGGGKRCGVPGCTKSARGRTSFCVRHGGGKRCKFEGCGKSAQGSTDYCKAHGGGKRCLWGQPDSSFGGGSVSACDKFGRGKIGLCAAHAAQVRDKRVHGNGTVCMEMKETATGSLIEHAYNLVGESSIPWNGLVFEGYEHDSTTPHNVLSSGEPLNSTSLPEGRVHGGGLMAMLGRC